MVKPHTIARYALRLASLSNQATRALLARAHAALQGNAGAQYEVGYACHVATELSEQIGTAASWPQ